MKIILITLFFTLSGHAEQFPENYQQAKSLFKNALSNLTSQTHELIEQQLVISQNNRLTVDMAYLMSKKPSKNLVILLAGVHGPESFTGSAIQLDFIKNIFPKLNKPQTSYLLIHGFNPYGFHTHRRVDVNNIDLNRNFSYQGVPHKKANNNFEKLAYLLKPEGKVGSVFWGKIKTIVSFVKVLLFSGLSRQEVAQAIAGGQYQHPTNIYFGGLDQTKQVQWLSQQLKKVMASQQKVLFWDIHTGLGDEGVLHLITAFPHNSSSKQFTEKLYGKKDSRYKLTTPQTKGFYAAHGDSTEFIKRFAEPNAAVVSVTAEFGTLGTGLLEQLDSLNRMIRENQGHHHGYANPEIAQETKRQFLELFYPSDPAWRKKVITTGHELLIHSIQAL